MRRRWVLVALVAVAVGSLAGYAFADFSPAPKVSHETGWWSYPITSLAPGKLILARLRLRDGAPYFIYGQRIRFQGRLYFCLSAGNPSGSFQTCPPWPLAHGRTDLLLGGGPPLVELALDINPPGQQCTFIGIPGAPYRASRVPLPASLKIPGDLYYAFVKRPVGDGIPRSSKTATSVQFTYGSSGRARCGPPAPASPTINPVVASQLSVFRRPHTSADALPAAFRAELRSAFVSERLDLAEAQRVSAANGQTAYLVPTSRGVCVINTNEAFCSLAATLPGAETADLCSPTLPNGQIEMEWLLPDGATHVAVGMANRTATSFASGFNVYIARFPISGPVPKTIEWKAGGKRYSVSTAVPPDVKSQKCMHPNDLPPASQLPRTPPGPLGPRPQGSQATPKGS